MKDIPCESVVGSDAWLANNQIHYNPKNHNQLVHLPTGKTIERTVNMTDQTWNALRIAFGKSMSENKGK